MRGFGVVTAIDDFSPEGALQYVESRIDGKVTDQAELANLLESIANEIRKASTEGDALKK